MISKDETGICFIEGSTKGTKTDLFDLIYGTYYSTNKGDKNITA